MVVVAAVSSVLAASAVAMAVTAADGPDVTWGVLPQAESGALVLTVLAIVGGWALIELGRGSGLVVALGLVAVGVVELAVRIVEPLWVPWLPSTNLQALVHPGGLTLELFRNRGLVGTGEPVFEHVSQWQGGAVLGAVTVALVLAAGVHRRARRL